jgi:hypothetical protein
LHEKEGERGVCSRGRERKNEEGRGRERERLIGRERKTVNERGR